jgi:hypothetical protein
MTKANDTQIGGKHYKKLIEPWDYIVANGIGFLEGNAIKYLTRWKEKGGLSDLRKAAHYIQKLIEVEETSSSLEMQDATCTDHGNRNTDQYPRGMHDLGPVSYTKRFKDTGLPMPDPRIGCRVLNATYGGSANSGIIRAVYPSGYAGVFSSSVYEIDTDAGTKVLGAADEWIVSVGSV